MHIQVFINAWGFGFFLVSTFEGNGQATNVNYDFYHGLILNCTSKANISGNFFMSNPRNV